MTDTKLIVEKEIEKVLIIDTHEHICSSGVIRKLKRDLPYFISEAYLRDDLTSAGMPLRFLSERVDLETKWRELSPFLSYVSNTTSYRSLIVAFNKLFDLNISEIDDTNYREISKLLENAALQGEKWYRHVLKDLAHIETCFLDMDRTTEFEIELWKEKGFPSQLDSELEKEFFTRVTRIDLTLNIHRSDVRLYFNRRFSLDLRSLKQFDELIAKIVDEAKARGSAALKCVGAYFREIYFAKEQRAEAENAFERMVSAKNDLKDNMVVQNYAVHRFLEEAGRSGLPFQFHTGMQALNENVINNSNPILLNNLFLEYPTVRFIMLHGGYPFSSVAGVIVKKFPNVYLDFSFLPQLSYTAARDNLAQWLDLVPANKITWGGDARQVEDTFANVLLLREILTDVLTEKIEKKLFTEELAMSVARNIMHDNPIRIYKLNNTIKGGK